MKLSKELKELEKYLIGLLIRLGGTEIESTIAVALMRVHNCHEEIAEWVMTFRGKEEQLTLSSYMTHLYDLTQELQQTQPDNECLLY